MPWFKVDDQLHAHPKWRELPKGARALWVTAGTWSASQLTDGHVPRGMLRMLDGTPGEARALVAAGLWDEMPDGWQYHDWTAYQPKRADVLDHRRRESERKAEWRAKKKERSA